MSTTSMPHDDGLGELGELGDAEATTPIAGEVALLEVSEPLTMAQMLALHEQGGTPVMTLLASADEGSEGEGVLDQRGIYAMPLDFQRRLEARDWQGGSATFFASTEEELREDIGDLIANFALQAFLDHQRGVGASGDHSTHHYKLTLGSLSEPDTASDTAGIALLPGGKTAIYYTDMAAVRELLSTIGDFAHALRTLPEASEPGDEAEGVAGRLSVDFLLTLAYRVPASEAGHAGQVATRTHD